MRSISIKKIICLIFGHDGYTYNSGTYYCPEQAWACHYCGDELTYDTFYGLQLKPGFTGKLYRKSIKKHISDEHELPF